MMWLLIAIVLFVVVLVLFNHLPEKITRSRVYELTPLIVLVVFAIYNTMRWHEWNSYWSGFFTASVAMMVGIRFGGKLLDKLFPDHFYGDSAYKMYRRWYLMCRNELERLGSDYPDRVIGKRTSSKEDWED